MVDVPVWPFLHGVQSDTTTGPATPLAPLWMCACIAGPVSFANVSFHFSVCPLSVPLNKPWAAASLTTCFGTSWPELSAAVQTVVWAAPSESAASASAQTAPAANNDTSLLILSSSPGRWSTLVVSPSGNSVELGLRFALRTRPPPARSAARPYRRRRRQDAG